MNTQELEEQAHKEFDEISERQIFLLNGKKGTLKNTIVYQSLAALIDSLIDRTVQMERERIVRMIKNMSIRTVGNSAETVNQIIGLITDNE